MQSRSAIPMASRLQHFASTKTAAYSVSRNQGVGESTGHEAPEGNERDKGGSHVCGLLKRDRRNLKEILNLAYLRLIYL
jgi:hypothetical protein